jgi:cytochrome c oxidase cbb3-type subunit 1
MTPTTGTGKSMSLGEGGTALAFVALAVSSIFGAARAYTPEYAFHAWLAAAAGVATVFAIVNRYYERPGQLPPLTIEGKPNYNMGPLKCATVAAVFWGGRSVLSLTALAEASS